MENFSSVRCFLNELEAYFKKTPKEEIIEDWNKSEENDTIGPTVEEFFNNMPIRATTPKEFDPVKHKVLQFKRNNYEGSYVLCPDGYYYYTGDSASYIYTEGALLAMSDVEVVLYVERKVKT